MGSNIVYTNALSTTSLANGNPSYFISSVSGTLVSGLGGTAAGSGTFSLIGGAGGAGSVSETTTVSRVSTITGGKGGQGGSIRTASDILTGSWGGYGGGTCIASSNASGGYGEQGVSAAANTGAGGGGAGMSNVAEDGRMGGGGGGGGCAEAEIRNPESTYTVTVGTGGAGATGDTYVGGAGGSGLVVVEEFYDHGAVRADQTNYDWTSYTPTPTGFGTASSYECQHKRDGSDLLLRCKFTVGTSTATEARVSLPGSLITDPVRVPSIQMCGDAVRSAAAGSIQRYLTTCEASAAYVTFVLQSSGAGGLTKAQGSAIVGAGESWNFTARVPISGWIESQNAPILVGSVTSGTAGAERIERALLNCDASSAITSQSGTWLSAIGNRSTAACSITIASGVFSDTPTCTFTVKAATVQATAVNMTSATAGTVYGASADYDGYLICIGPR
jgi:hypothetical protein